MKKTGLADSPFFLKPAQPHAVKEGEAKSPAKTERFSERKSERNSERKSERSHTPPAPAPVPTAIPERRKTTRYSFEFFEDQIVDIKRLKYQAEMEGRKVSLSDFARQAFDTYLKQQKK